ncbi:MAG TPA: cbb3-type cytochrome c oxidase subunit I [Gammaproteobacteria bacterium]
MPALVTRDEAARHAAKLKALWETSPGLKGWLATVDHKELGKRYLITAFVFLLLGGLEAAVMRWQLMQPDMHVLTPEAYAQLFTMHGITMIFLYAFPVLTGFSVYLWPLLLGCRDLAFPRLNAFTYWIFLFSGLLFYASFAAGWAPNNGWYNYVPYASQPYNPGPNIDVYAMAMILLGISTTGAAINFIVTLVRLRAPGMSINRIPILVWGTITAAMGNLFAVPAVSLAFALLWFDRQFNTHFYDVSQGGQPLLWQHLFWMFGHPWVYAIVLPAMGIVSDGIPIFCRRPLVGYSAVVLSTIATMVLGFGVWVHHMFATGIPMTAASFFSSASFIIVIPSAVAVFAWIATVWTGRPQFTAPFLFFAGFVLLFVIGGVSGFMTAAVPLDWQLTHTYFVVGHIHYVIIGINVFPVIAGVHLWFPKMTGRMMSEKLGKWSFWVMFVGFNLGFFPMHIVGLQGMPRRIYTYAADTGWGGTNLVITLGSYLFAAGVLLFLSNVVWSRWRGRPAGPNPWDGPTLEWSVSSPPPAYNFAVIPVVASRHPLWDGRLREEAVASSLDEGYLLAKERETLGTTPVDAEPDAILRMPRESLMPLLVSLALLVVFLGFSIHGVSALACWVLAGLGGAGTLACGIAWLWPHRYMVQTLDEDAP